MAIAITDKGRVASAVRNGVFFSKIAVTIYKSSNYKKFDCKRGEKGDKKGRFLSIFAHLCTVILFFSSTHSEQAHSFPSDVELSFLPVSISFHGFLWVYIGKTHNRKIKFAKSLNQSGKPPTL